MRHLLAALFALGMLTAQPARAGDILVFAASSTMTALQEVAEAWSDATGHTATLSFAGSSALARQIEAGAPADVFLSANPDWMDALAEQALIRPETRVGLLSNELVLIAAAPARPLDLAELPEMLGDEWLAMAFVDAVPAGMYGQEALRSLGLWDRVAPRVAQTDNVRTALALVSSGEAPFGIVYATDAAADGEVAIVARFPPESHRPIVYPAAATSDGEAVLAEDFLRFLGAPAASEIFRRHGFIPLAPPE